jgi:tetratricopeptide (TPR) repeat protein
VKLWRAKQGSQAIERFEAALRLDPGNAQANFSMGIIYESAGNFIEAQACYKRALEQSPGNKEYADAVASVSRKANDKTNKQDKQGRLRVLAEDANAAYARGEFISALSLFKQLDQLAPNQALVKYNIGTCYMAIKNPVDALDYYKQARKLKPNEERYITACEKLEANLNAARKKREEAENAYVQPPQPKSHSKGHPPKNDSYGQALTPGAGDPMSSVGLIGRNTKEGVVVTAVGLASRAARVGFLNGDLIKAVNGKIVKNLDQINKLLLQTNPQAPIQMTVQRGANMGQVTF